MISWNINTSLEGESAFSSPISTCGQEPVTYSEPQRANRAVDRGLSGVRSEGLLIETYLQDKTRYCAGNDPSEGSK